MVNVCLSEEALYYEAEIITVDRDEGCEGLYNQAE